MAEFLIIQRRLHYPLRGGDLLRNRVAIWIGIGWRNQSEWGGGMGRNTQPLSGLKVPSEISAMKRGEVWWVNFDPSSRGEIRKQRPAVIVSNDAANRYLNRVQVVPLTSSVDKLYPSEAYVTFRGKKAKAMADQLTTVSKKRLINSAGSISSTEMESIGKAITTQLGL